MTSDRLRSFSLTPDDALAYERLPGELPGLQKFWLVASVAAIGLGAGLLPETWPARAWWAFVVGLGAIWLLFVTVGRRWLTRWRARRSAAQQGEVSVTDHGNHLEIANAQGRHVLAFEQIGKVIVDSRHVFILYHGGPAIIPLRAFEDEAEMRAFGASVDQRSHDSVA